MVPVENFRKSVFLFLFFNRISISRVVGSMFRMRSLMFMVKIVVFLNPCERIFIVEKTLNLAEKVDIENYCPGTETKVATKNVPHTFPFHRKS